MTTGTAIHLFCARVKSGVLIEESLGFHGREEDVWKRVAAIDDIPKYWHGTKSLRRCGAVGENPEFDVKFAFGGTGRAVIKKDDKGRTLTIDYMSGPFKGRQVVAVDSARISAKWDIEFVGLYKLASSWNARHFRSGTRNALQRLVTGQINAA
jgi:hypothetical protein